MNRMFFMALIAWCTAAAAAPEGCRRVRFSDGHSINMRSSHIKSINATLESPAIQVFSVSIAPPTDQKFSDVSSIIVEPESRSSLGRESVCSVKNLTSNCAGYRIFSEFYISIYFNKDRNDSRDAVVEGVREYVLQQVLNCP
jgi:hypothetical protein